MANLESISARATLRRWLSPDLDRAVYEMEGAADGMKFVAVGPPSSSLAMGVPCRLHGTWQTHRRHGRQFAFSAATREILLDEVGLTAYLKQIEGIGAARAAALWNAYGQKAIEVLRERPASVANARILPASVAFEAARVLEKNRSREAVTLEMFSLLAGRGFQIDRVIKFAIGKWGDRAAETIKRNPYHLLLARVPSAGWGRTDKLYIDLGGRPDRLKRQALVGYHWVLKAGGHTWHSARDVALAIRAACGQTSDPVKAIRLAVRGGLFALWRSGNDRFVAISQEAKDESALAALVRLLLNGDSTQ